MSVQLISSDSCDEGFATVSVYAPSDSELLELSYETLWSCRHTGDEGLCVVNVKDISFIVAMIPHALVADEALHTQLQERVYMVDKLGIDLLIMAGVTEVDKKKISSNTKSICITER